MITCSGISEVANNPFPCILELRNSTQLLYSKGIGAVQLPMNILEYNDKLGSCNFFSFSTQLFKSSKFLTIIRSPILKQFLALSMIERNLLGSVSITESNGLLFFMYNYN